MDTDNDDTLFELAPPDSVEKPKRKATPRQLAALAKARQIRIGIKQRQLEEEEKHSKLLPTHAKEPDPEPMLPKEKKATSKKVRPTIIQFQESDGESDDDAPTIIIKNKKRAPTPAPAPVPVAAPLPVPVAIVEQKPKQYIRRAY